MIVKNEEKHLARCLSSVKDVVDQIVVVDTGSTDVTIRIAESFNANIFNFDWVNDFSAARNFALSKCTGDWILYLDADEELKKSSISELFNNIIKKPAAINCIVKSLTSEKSKFGVMKYPRLFPNNLGIRFEGKVHEQIQSSLDKNKIQLIDSNIEIIHYGYILDEDSANKKLERNLALLLSSETKKQNHYDTLRLAQTLHSLKRYDEAEKNFKNLCNDKTAKPNLRGLAFMHYAILKYENNELNDALINANNAFKFIPNNAYLNFLISILHLRNTNAEKSFQYLLTAIEKNKRLLQKQDFTENEIVSDQIDLYLRGINLALQLNNENKLKILLYEFSEFLHLEKEIDLKYIHKILMQFILSGELNDEEINFFISLINSSNLQSFLDLLQKNHNLRVKQNILTRLGVLFKNNAAIKKSFALNYLDNDVEKSIKYFKESLELEEDPSIYFHLISIYLGKNAYKEAKTSYLTLSEKYSNQPLVKQKVQILGEKLEQIFHLNSV
jgi:glycosyltransferase involved in cell wall biosynthesis